MLFNREKYVYFYSFRGKKLLSISLVDTQQFMYTDTIINANERFRTVRSAEGNWRDPRLRGKTPREFENHAGNW